jgi:hypothetical protein
MGRYRKTDPRMYGDEKFRRLSKPQPNGQTLFHYLFTGPHTTNLPGLSILGEAGLAEALGWSISGCRAAWRTVCAAGLAEADWEARVVWVPNVIKYDPPESPSVVKSWGTRWDEIPECQLKLKAYVRLRAWMAGCGTAWGTAFEQAVRQPVAQGVPHPEPEPEPEPEPKPLSVAETRDGFQSFWSLYPRNRRKEKPTAEVAFRAARKKADLETILRALRADVDSEDWEKDDGKFIPYPAKWLKRERWLDLHPVGEYSQASLSRADEELRKTREEIAQREARGEVLK